MPKVHDVMRPNPMTCHETDPVFKAVEVMKWQDVGVVPVVDENEVCRGLVTDHDIVLQIVYHNQDPKSVPLRNIMNHGLVTCDQDEDLDLVAQHMHSRGIRCVLVLDHDNHCVGILSESDLAQPVGEPRKLRALSRGIPGGVR